MPKTNSVNNFEATTKGDLFVFDGTEIVPLAAGVDGQVLTADSSTASGLKYAAPGGGGGSQEVFVQATQPTPLGEALWVQTNVNGRSSDYSLWVIY